MKKLLFGLDLTGLNLECSDKEKTLGRNMNKFIWGIVAEAKNDLAGYQE